MFVEYHISVGGLYGLKMDHSSWTTTGIAMHDCSIRAERSEITDLRPYSQDRQFPFFFDKKAILRKIGALFRSLSNNFLASESNEIKKRAYSLFNERPSVHLNIHIFAHKL
ncbi:hypothetical protein ECG_06455 [Echinococcus granulosus]|nr:hypothetical protein ECG_06455 [Echinococcus granulosus]